MKQEQMQRLQLEIHERLEQLRAAGQKEYAHGEGDEVFANFHRVAHTIGIDRKKVLWTYMQKHLDGITAAMNGHLSQREPVYGRIMDAIVYLELLYGMFLEDERYGQLERSQMLQPLSGVDNFGAGLRMVDPSIVDPGASSGQGGGMANTRTESPEFAPMPMFSPTEVDEAVDRWVPE